MATLHWFAFRDGWSLDSRVIINSAFPYWLTSVHARITNCCLKYIIHISLIHTLTTYLVFDWTHSRSELRPSPRTPRMFDQPQDAVQWLKNFRSSNAQFMSEVSWVVKWIPKHCTCSLMSSLHGVDWSLAEVEWSFTCSMHWESCQNMF